MKVFNHELSSFNHELSYLNHYTPTVTTTSPWTSYTTNYHPYPRTSTNVKHSQPAPQILISITTLMTFPHQHLGTHRFITCHYSTPTTISTHSTTKTTQPQPSHHGPQTITSFNQQPTPKPFTPQPLNLPPRPTKSPPPPPIQPKPISTNLNLHNNDNPNILFTTTSSKCTPSTIEIQEVPTSDPKENIDEEDS